MSSVTFMDDQKSSEADKMDHEVILPGFRFHPTDEELVGFYLKKKIQCQVFPNAIIKQVDIYKYDPWDLPNLAPLGEKEWYFYCPRDRKYKNSSRPNRVTGAGFWKATGTDRPIYSSNGAKCIGLKKSLVFYRGRAAKAIKTDWMMHEFRLPSVVEPEQNKKIQDKSIHPNDAWAVCKIFKKTNSIAQRANALLSSLPEDRTSEHFTNTSQFSPDNISCMTDHLSNYSGLEIPSYLPVNQSACKPSPLPLPCVDISTNGFLFSSTNAPESRALNLEDASKNCESIDFGGEPQPLDNFLLNHYTGNEVGIVCTGGFPIHPSSVSATVAVADEWSLNMAWDSPPCHSSSSIYSTNKCHM